MRFINELKQNERVKEMDSHCYNCDQLFLFESTTWCPSCGVKRINSKPRLNDLKPIHTMGAVEINSVTLDCRVNKLASLIKDAHSKGNHKLVLKLKKDIEKLNQKRRTVFETAKAVNNSRIEVVLRRGFKLVEIRKEAKRESFEWRHSPSHTNRLKSIQKKNDKLKKLVKKKMNNSILQNLVVRSLVTGWSNSEKSAGSIRGKLEFEFENPKGLSRCRCATSLKATRPMGSLSWAIVFDPRDIIKGYKTDCMSHADGRKGRTRKCEARYNTYLMTQQEIDDCCSGKVLPNAYPEFFIKPGAKPIGIFADKTTLFSESFNELKKYCEEKGLEFFGNA